MGAEQGGNALLELFADAEGGQLTRQVLGQALLLAQSLQRRDHVAVGGEAGAGRIGAVLPPAREPEHDHAGQEAQYQFRHDGHRVVTQSVTALGLEYHPVHGVADDACQEHDEGVYHALDHGQGDHVAVGHMADFMGQHRAHFLRAKALQQAGAHRYQRGVAIPAGGEGIGSLGGKYAHFGHAYARLPGQFLHGGEQPLLIAVAGLFDDVGAGAALGHPLGQEQ